MTTTELIKLLEENEIGGISKRPREISFSIPGLGELEGIDCTDDFIKGEGAQQLKRMTKDQIIECTHACLKILFAYIGIRYRYDSLKAAFDILRDANTGHLKLIRRIDELYGEAEEESLGFKWNTEKTRRLDAMFEDLPQEAWLQ